VNRISLNLIATGMAGAVFASSQPNRIPGPLDYVSFSHFIADHNIFNPDRPKYSNHPDSNANYPHQRKRRRHAGRAHLGGRAE